jgi:DNA-binding XRE family transcriptional regulator
MLHQDFTPITLKSKKIEPKKTTQITYTKAPIKYDENNQEIIKEYKLSQDELKEYIKMRNELKLNRTDLAKKLCCNVTEINLIESSKPCSSKYGGKYKNWLKLNYNKFIKEKEKNT